MKQRIIFWLIMLLFMAASIVPPIVVASADSTSMSIYVIPATDEDIVLDTDSISSSYLTNQITMTACRGEYKPARLVIHSIVAISSLTATPSNLVSSIDTIPASNVDIKSIQSWMQFDTKYHPANSPRLTPELLLYDKMMVKAENGNNYIWLENTYANISGAHEIIYPNNYLSIAEFPVKDSSSLQPVNIAANGGIQYWITVHIPDEAAAGTYTGTISLDAGSECLEVISLSLVVLPFELSAYPLINNVYYDGQLNSVYPDGQIGRVYKSVTQLTAEYQDMFNHGVNYPMVAQNWDDTTYFNQVLDIIKNIGFPTDKIFLHGKERNLGYGTPSDAATLAAITSEVEDVVALCRTKGFNDVYFYGIDEAGTSTVEAELPAWEAIHAGGGKVFVAGRHSNVYPVAGDVLDLLNDSTETDWSSVATEWQASGGEITQYSNPQCGLENPLAYRLYAGLQLWQAGLDGIMDWNYQGHYGTAWNEFDYSNNYPYIYDYMMTYPTVDGVVSTIQWEGWREGVYDLRYLATLQQVINDAKASGKTTSIAEDWLGDLKNSDLTTQDLDAIRSQMINYILDLTDTLDPTYTLGPTDTNLPTVTNTSPPNITSPSVWRSFEYALELTTVSGCLVATILTVRLWQRVKYRRQLTRK